MVNLLGSFHEMKCRPVHIPSRDCQSFRSFLCMVVIPQSAKEHVQLCNNMQGKYNHVYFHIFRCKQFYSMVTVCHQITSDFW